MGFIIKYEGENLDEGMNIKDFGESLIGFSEFSKEVFKIGKIKTDIDVKITSVRKGSIIVDIIISINDYLNSFSSLQDFLYFIEITNIEFYKEIIIKLQEFSNSGVEKWKDIESFAKDYPLLSGIIGAGTYDLIKTTIKTIKDYGIKNLSVDKISNSENINIGNGKIIKGETIKEIKKLVDKGKSADFLEPIINDKVSKISVGDSNETLEINDGNFESFIGEGNEIIPELENGKKYHFNGSFTAMQSNKGETITFISHHYKNSNNQPFYFSCYLLDGKTTEDYAEYYGASKSLKIHAEVIRFSNYKKPKLKILTVELYQTSLNI